MGVGTFDQITLSDASRLATPMWIGILLSETPKGCASCGKPMRLTRTIPELGVIPKLRSFECSRCGVYFIGEQASH
jgi:hypothetical protein